MPSWGRGGAGNIVTDEQVADERRRAAADLEANIPPPSHNAPTQRAASATASTTQEQPQTYAYTGRGGAGNYVVPISSNPSNNSSEKASASSANPSSNPPKLTTTTTPSQAPQQPSTPASASTTSPSPSSATSIKEHPFSGRGGAGNWHYHARQAEGLATLEEIERRKRAQQAREVSESVHRDVESGLAKPGKAYMGSTGERMLGVTGGIGGSRGGT